MNESINSQINKSTNQRINKLVNQSTYFELNISDFSHEREKCKYFRTRGYGPHGPFCHTIFEIKCNIHLAIVKLMLRMYQSMFYSA